jgi:3-oxoacyl-[acyl-carrier-protein] synthase-3
MFNSKVIGSGSYLPEKILTNVDLEKMVDTSDEWISERTGIKERRIIGENELTSDMAYEASKKALKLAGLKPQDIDMIIVATTTPDRTFPSTATIVQGKLGIKNAFAFDVQAVCSGFVYALATADKFIKSGEVKYALVIGADSLSRLVNWEDRNTCILFGDGAGAVIMEATEEKRTGVLSTTLYSDGKYADLLNTTGGVSLTKTAGFIEMEGKEIYKHAVSKMSEIVIESLEKANLKTKDVDWLIPHQANLKIMQSVAKRLNILEEKVIVTVDKQGNTSAATIPLAIDEALRDGKIKDGNIIALTALGGGLTWGSAIIKW